LRGLGRNLGMSIAYQPFLGQKMGLYGAQTFGLICFVHGVFNLTLRKSSEVALNKGQHKFRNNIKSPVRRPLVTCEWSY
jgi:hypothetical protein